jgi:hypothetical protein
MHSDLGHVKLNAKWFGMCVHYVTSNFIFVGGVVMFTRSLAPLKRHGIRVNVLCPEVLRFA